MIAVPRSWLRLARRSITDPVAGVHRVRRARRWRALTTRMPMPWATCAGWALLLVAVVAGAATRNVERSTWGTVLLLELVMVGYLLVFHVQGELDRRPARAVAVNRARRAAGKAARRG